MRSSGFNINVHFSGDGMIEDHMREHYIRGQDDCSNGVIHEGGKGYYYDLGYSDQYATEQMLGAVSG